MLKLKFSDKISNKLDSGDWHESKLN